MQEVKIGELKARLSHYLRLVQQGDEVLVKDRDRPVARLVRCNGPENRLKVIPPKMTFKEANKRLAKSRRPPLSREIFEDTLRWMREDRTDQWIADFKN
jgi:antitoxin (DNA-binding transcriptional repressor) of toxin-antitoxin stability system